MPTPKQGEKRNEYMARCIPMVMKEGHTQEQAKGECAGMWESHHGGKSMMSRRSVPLAVEEVSTNRYKAYVVMFGDADHLDLEGTYFNKNTAFHLDWFKTRPWLYHHGLNPDMGAVKIGDWDEVGMDETGVFFAGELAESFRYREAVQRLLDNKVLFPSTGALGYLVKVADDGWVSDWPIVEASSTVTPAEFRMEAFAPEIAEAVKTLEGGLVMDDVRGMVNEALEKLGLRKNGDPAAEVAAEVADDAPVEEVATPPVEPEAAEASAPEPAEEEPERAVTDEQLVVLLENQTQLIKAVQGLDELVQELRTENKALSTRLEQLAQSEVEKVKAAMSNKDWFSNLYLQSRDGKKSEDPPTPQSVNAGAEGGGSPYMQIRQAQGVGPAQ